MRYVAQRYGTWEILTRELPLEVAAERGPEWGLSMYGVIEGTIAPEAVDSLSVAEDGRPVLEEWGTLVHVEAGTGADRRRWSGIVDRVVPEGKALRVRVRELLGYVDGLIYTSNIYGVRVDPVEMVRRLWTHTQAQASGDMGVSILGSTGLSVGTDSDIKAEAVQKERDAAKAALDLRSKPRKAKQAEIRKVTERYQPILRPLADARKAATDEYDRLVKAKASKTAIAAQKAVVTQRQNAYNTRRDERDAITAPLSAQLVTLQDAEKPWAENLEEVEDRLTAAKEQLQQDGGSIRIEASDFPDIWKEVTELANEYGFELTTRTVWREGKPDYRVQAHYPQAGKVRDDLVFQLGLNVTAELLPDREVYASEFLGRGAGEGDAAVRANLTLNTKRARRNMVVQRPTARTKARLQAEINAEAKRSQGELEVPSITVRDSDFAPLWSWSPGDSILVRGTIPHVGNYSAWHRIKSWRLLSEHEAKLYLERVTVL